jgi:hypothetical protein
LFTPDPNLFRFGVVEQEREALAGTDTTVTEARPPIFIRVLFTQQFNPGIIDSSNSRLTLL